MAEGGDNRTTHSDAHRAVPVRGSDAVLERVGRDAIIHDRVSGRVHVINASAARLWELCDGRTLDDVTRAFAASYGLNSSIVRDDVAALVQQFRSLGLMA